MSERMILCPVCRVAWPDSKYYEHAMSHQRGSITVDGVVRIVLPLCIVIETAMAVALISLLRGIAG